MTREVKSLTMYEILTPSRRDRKFLDLALRVAELSTCRKRHGCVLVKSGSVLALGVNRMRNDPAVIESDVPGGRGTIYSYHAEAQAMSKAAQTKGATLYIARLNASGAAYSRCCSRCLTLAMQNNIKAICYTV